MIVFTTIMTWNKDWCRPYICYWVIVFFIPTLLDKSLIKMRIGINPKYVGSEIERRESPGTDWTELSKDRHRYRYKLNWDLLCCESSLKFIVDLIRMDPNKTSWPSGSRELIFIKKFPSNPIDFLPFLETYLILENRYERKVQDWRLRGQEETRKYRGGNLNTSKNYTFEKCH